MEREKLTKLARELNDLLGIAPPINADDPDDLLGAACQEAAGLLEKGDTLSDTAVEALKELGCSDALKKIGIKVMKTSKEKKEKGPSNKGMIFSAWKNGTTDISTLFELANKSVKESTIKGWIAQWKNGKNLPAIAKQF